MPVTVGGVRVEPGDVVVMDGDDAVVVPAGRAEEVLEAGRRREADEAAMMDKLRAGAPCSGPAGPEGEAGGRRWLEPIPWTARELQPNVRTQRHRDRHRSGNRGWRPCADAVRPPARG